MAELDVKTRASAMKTLSRSEAFVPAAGISLVGVINVGALIAAISFGAQGNIALAGIFAGIVGAFTVEKAVNSFREKD